MVRIAVLLSQVLLATVCSSTSTSGVKPYDGELHVAEWLSEAAFGEERPRHDVRVTKGMGVRGYDTVRVSVISTSDETPELRVAPGVVPVGADDAASAFGAEEDAPLQRLRLDVVDDDAASSFDETKEEEAVGVVPWEHSAPFAHKWTHAYDLGTKGPGCDRASELRVLPKAVNEADCQLHCNADAQCAFYRFDHHSKECRLSTSACRFEPAVVLGLAKNWTNDMTYHKLGQQHLHSAVVRLTPGASHVLSVDGEEYSVRLPAQGKRASGIVWSDPCVGSIWIDCMYGDRHGLLDHTFEVVNAIAAAEQDETSFFQILGDNFYDQDGRLTKAVFDKFNRQVKAKFFQTVVGNHDLWVGGGPPGGVHDQFGHGFMQFYAQDTVASVAGDGASMFNSSVLPSSPHPPDASRNAMENFFWFHEIGNLGFVGFNGFGPQPQSWAQLRRACAFFGRPGGSAKHLLVMGHWNVDVKLTVPVVRRGMLDMPGCSAFGTDGIKFLEGHEHCNLPMPETHALAVDDNNKRDAPPAGFMIGGHGMHGTPKICDEQVGFAYVASADEGDLAVYYFEIYNKTGIDGTPTIVDCLAEKGGIQHCTHLARKWL